MIFKNDNIGLLVGTFFGSVIGSIGTILVFKKLGKLEEKKLNMHEEEHIEELKQYYENKIKNITNNIVAAPECIKTAEKVVKQDAKVETKPLSDKQTRITFNDVEIQENNKPLAQFDYSKISKEEYTNLQKEYEREEIKAEYDEHPHQITKSNYELDKGFHKMELMYYEQNGLFTYMDDDICNTVTEEVIGADNLALFGTDDASIDGLSGMYDLYLRSSKIMTDFHLIYNGTEDYYKVMANKQ